MSRSATPTGRLSSPVLVAAVDRAREVLGWTAHRPTLEEMIGSAWAWRRAHLDERGAPKAP